MSRLRCRKYAVITAYLPLEAPWTHTLRELAESGAEIVFKDEASRRIVVKAAKTRIPGVISILANRTLGLTVEIKAACKPASRVNLEKLVDEGFLVVPQGRSPVYYGLVESRIIMVERVKGSIIVKVGIRSQSRPKSMPPASSFMLHPSDIEEALEALDRLLLLLRR